jgi:hypothetical protein
LHQAATVKAFAKEREEQKSAQIDTGKTAFAAIQLQGINELI